MMTEEDRTIQMGMIIAADNLGFGFAETGEGSELPVPLSLWTSSSGFELRNCAARSTSMGRPPCSKNFSVDIVFVVCKRKGRRCEKENGKANKGEERND